MKKTIKQILSLLLALALVGQIVPPAAAAADGSVTIDAATFPDQQFRSWLQNPSNIAGYGADGVLTEEELSKITSINVSGQNISSLEGIEVFEALESLNCKNNRLTALDVRSNTNLKHLQCALNSIKELDVSGLRKLISLTCENNNMESLDTTGCTAMEIIYCRNNRLPSVDFTTNTALKFIETFDNRLTSIDLSTLTNLEFVHIDHNQLTTLDLSHNTSLVPDGSGFVARNNYLDTLTLPEKSDLLVDPDVYAEQDPKTGYARVEWYSDALFTQPVTGPVTAQGQTLYAKWLPNDYTIYFQSSGASGSTDAQKAVWNTPVTLNANGFTRIGFTFAGWENRYGDGKTYTDRQEVTNLAGKIQGDRVTLFAKWTPISYHIAFDANGGEGDMETQTVRYDQTVTVTNGFTAPEGKEFAGWSRSSNGRISYANNAEVWKLTDTEGKTVTLYAIWRDKLSNQYLQQLDEAFTAYDSALYTAEDWETLTNIHTTAIGEITDASDAGKMQSLLDQAKIDMDTVPTIADHSQDVLDQWHDDHSAAFSSKVTAENAGTMLEAARAAASGLTTELVETATSLSTPSDQELVLAQVLSEAAGDLHYLSTLSDAALWAGKLDGAAGRPMTEVTSDLYPSYASLCEEAAAHSRHLDGTLTSDLTARRDLAQSKQQAVAQLRQDFASYDLSRYSEAKAQELEALFQKALTDLEAASSTGSVASLLQTAQAAMAAVPDKDQEQKPGGGSTGGGSTGGGSTGGGSTGGGSTGGGSIGGGSTGGSTEPPVEENPKPEEKPQDVSYTDVAESAWYYADVQYVSAHGMMQGHNDGRFDPDGRLSRSQLAQILYNLEGRPAVSGSSSFTDVADGAWYGPAMAWAVEAGILTGYGSGKVGPDDAITREQLATMLLRYARSKGMDVSKQADLSSFADANSVSGYAQEALAWANANGIVQGSDGSLLPGGTASRAQAASMLTRFCKLNPAS